MFNRIKRFYDRELWTIEQVHFVVGLRRGLTPEEYEEITGEKYVPKE